ncbi:sensor histidine kinase [Actinoalloteichus hymeniacidonis]|uniref:histidine kinase n=1 Tax=Actinoalloteichus hymeniacidonis TaxID=340345 RepID=A0AAC9N069_9PSEU|nr:nitrate- and nitrite sensing domain-containing protein [Actinoalloteichus hymeniacidonis]AOS64787.1 HAMP domain-containing protein,histidine kinase [Actinoalloteichus hymeniacidonis]MBB5907138.1 signal transduction histidine kinase/uncharacterized protein YoxC [Actinoalloteichus hymeniacidonis]
MKRIPTWLGRRQTIRSRVLAIALIPSIALLVLGIGAAGYLLNQGNTAREWSNVVEAAIDPQVRFITELEEERRLSLLRLAGDTQDSGDLEQQRTQVDSVLVETGEVDAALRELNPDAMRSASDVYADSLDQLPTIRQGVDTGQLPIRDAYNFYNQLVDVIGLTLQGVAQTAPDPAAAGAEATATELFHLVEGMARANALGAGSIASGVISVEDMHEYRRQVDTYHVGLEQLLPRLTSEGRASYAEMTQGEAWQRLTSMENAIIDRGLSTSAGGELPLNVQAWQESASEVTEDLLGLWSQHHRYAQQLAATSGQGTFTNSLLAGALVLIIAVAAMVIAARLSNRLIRRLKNLRNETLDSAEVKLPALIERLSKGEEITPETDIPRLSAGDDELGEVAAAFDKAQQAAVSAAAQEAKTRAGMNAVFLNIAHRSQVVVRRQLEVLDEAESKQEDPKHLELLFKLDHLATRARRNAENLVILGGERPGRRWRNPVPLDEIVRSAVSETEGYARVQALRLPDVSMEGGVVADLIHLLAELVDNATSFSPPDSRVEVRGNLVGKGVVVEVEDQGLGIPEKERERINHTLHDPPNFEVMTLSERMRLGLFVVAQLAHRHGVTVTLAESAYGGIHAIVLIPASLMATKSEDDQRTELPRRQAAQTLLPEQRAERRSRYEPADDAPKNKQSASQPAVTTSDAGASSGSTNGSTVDRDAPTADPDTRVIPAVAADSGSETGKTTEPDPMENPVSVASTATQREVPTAAVHWPEEDMSSEKPTTQSSTSLPRRQSSAGLPIRTPSASTPSPSKETATRPATPRPPTAESTPGGASASGPAPAGPAAAGTAPKDTRAPLPRRRKQRNLAPQLTGEIRTPGPAPTDIRPARSPEEARAAMSAFVRGSKEGRDTQTNPDL